MEKEFVPYELAVKLKELGFDEDCIGYYYDKNFVTILHRLDKEVVKTPTFSQAFRWFREKHKLIHHVNWVYRKMEGIDWYFTIKGIQMTNNNVLPYSEIRFETYEEAEVACLDNLIDMVELKQK